MSTQTEPFVHVQLDNHIAHIRFFHPSGNAFPAAQLNALEAAFLKLSTQSEVHAIVLQSEGQGPFCAGASFDELLQVQTEAEGLAFFSGFARVINAMRLCPQWIVGRVHGKAVGGGVGLIAACDYVFATDKAAIKLSEIAIGIGPFVIEPAVSRKMGTQAMTALAYAPEQWQTSAWAHQHHLYQQLFADTDSMDAALTNYIHSLRTYNPDAMRTLKAIAWEGTAHWAQLLPERAAISGRLVLSDFTRNALSALKK